MSRRPLTVTTGQVAAVEAGGVLIELDDGDIVEVTRRASSAPVVAAGDRVVLQRTGRAFVLLDREEAIA